MGWILPIIGIIASGAMIYYREPVGDMFGEAEWMRKVGGVYFVVVYVAIFFFFWSLAELTGTTDVLFAPIKNNIPGFTPAAEQVPSF